MVSLNFKIQNSLNQNMNAIEIRGLKKDIHRYVYATNL